MGSFSWLKADKLTQIANIVEGETFKFLIPAEFGGGFIQEKYRGYGYLGQKENGRPKHDIYELLAIWNFTGTSRHLRVIRTTVDDVVLIDFDTLDNLKEIDELTDKIRNIGIGIGCGDEDIDQLRYPLKLVSPSFKGTYEECEGRSYNDPNQGGWKLMRRKPSTSPEPNITSDAEPTNDWPDIVTETYTVDSFTKNLINQYNELKDKESRTPLDIRFLNLLKTLLKNSGVKFKGE